MTLDELRAFLEVIERGSVSAASRHLGVPRNTLRRRLASLEDSVGTPLLVKGELGFTPTSVGRRLVDRAPELVADADQLIEGLRRSVVQEDGLIRILLPTSIHPVVAAIGWRMVREQQPTKRVEWRFLEDPVGALETDGDVAMHWGQRVPADVGLAQRVGSVPLRLVAHRAYVASRGLPTTIDELRDHDILGFEHPDLTTGTLPLRAGGTIPMPAALMSTNVVAVAQAAQLGTGIGLMPNIRLPGDGWPEEDAVVVLGDIIGHDMPVWIVARGALSERPSLRPLIDGIAAIMATVAVEAS